MSDQQAPVVAAPSKEEQRAERQRFIDEQRALGRVQVSGWVPKELAPPARSILAAILAGDTSYLPATIAEREAQLRSLPATLADLAAARLALDTAERKAAALRQAGTSSEPHPALESAQREAAHHRDDAAAAHAQVETLQRALAEAQRQRTLADQHLAEATAALVEAQGVMHRLSQPGLRASLARCLLP